MADYGTERKAFALRVPMSIWNDIELLRNHYCRLNGEVSMNTWIEVILADKVREERAIILTERLRGLGSSERSSDAI